MNRSRRKTSALLLAALGSAAIEAQACGELMLRGLGTMRFHAFATQTPANILLYSGGAAANGRPSSRRNSSAASFTNSPISQCPV